VSGGVTVHGGSDGIQAEIDDLVTARHLFSAAADGVDDVSGTCLWLSIALAETDSTGDVWGARHAQDALRSAVARVRNLDGDIRYLTLTLGLAIARYRDTDSSVLGQIGSMLSAPIDAVVKLPGAIVDSGAALVTGGPAQALQTFVTDDPELVDTTIDALSFAAGPVGSALAKALADTYFDDGHPVVTATGNVRMAATAPPRSLAELMAALSSTDGGEDGEVDVRILTGPDGRRRVIVDIPGTKDWGVAHESPDVVGWATNIRAIDGERTSYEKGVLDAMTRAGVRPTDDVMVVGHSLGGMVAVALARDAVRSGRFNVTHVVTAGSPIGRFAGQLPANVQVLALENEHDVVPHLDGVENPDLPNVTTATFEADDGTIGGDHGIDTSYELGAAEVDASDDPAIRTFLDGASGYFSATAAQTRSYVITRD
jgi:pimeloyl-ACP methyl ester carboxylesterase